ncbi:hypothetical protein [Methanospirillum purgamenti]|nr:hypothetical protein [Methanospirillum hungatei]
MDIIPSYEFVTQRVANLMSHKDTGQLDRKVRMSAIPTIDPFFCTDKDEVVPRYSILHEGKQIFASKIMLYLPSEEEVASERFTEW